MTLRTPTVFRLVSVLILGFLLWAGWYTYNKGFTRKWREMLVTEFRKRGIEVSVRRLTLDPFAGLVAKDVQIFDNARRDHTLAVINHLALDINYGNLMRGLPFLNGIDLRDADLTLPIDPGKPSGRRLAITGLKARVFLGPDQIHFSQAEANFYGVHISASGTLIKPETYTSNSQAFSNENLQARREAIERFVDEMQKIRTGRVSPRLEVKFTGNIAELENLFVEAAFRAPQVERDSARLKDLALTAVYRNGVVDVTRFEVADAQGKMFARGTFVPASGDLRFQCKSTLQLQPILMPFMEWPALRELTFYEPPDLEVTSEGSIKDLGRLRLIGRIDLDKFLVRSVPFEGFSTEFSWNGEGWYLRDLRLRERSGQLSAQLLSAPGSVRIGVDSTVNPSRLAPLMPEKVRQFLADWEFSTSPRIQATGNGTSFDPANLQADGTLSLGRAKFRGVSVNSASSRFRLRDRAVTYEGFQIERKEGSGSGTFTYDFGKHEVRLQKVRSTLNTEVAVWLDDDGGIARIVAPYKFRNRPGVTVDGIVRLHDQQGTRLEIGVDAPRGMDYVFLGKTLPLSAVSGRVLVTDGRVQLLNVKGQLFSGQLRGEADIEIAKDNPAYRASVEAERIDFESVTKLYFDYNDSKGLLSGEYRFAGRGPDSRTIQGDGSVSVVDGNVFAIPVLGPFSGILSGIVPGMGLSIARKATATFTMNEGRVATNDLEIRGTGFTMLGGGWLGFAEDDMDFKMRINARGIPGVLLFPVSKLFEYESKGQLSKPAWKPKLLPRF